MVSSLYTFIYVHVGLGYCSSFMNAQYKATYQQHNVQAPRNVKQGILIVRPVMTLYTCHRVMKV